MATKYQIINVKDSRGEFEGSKFDNKMILCYSTETSKYLLCGDFTENLKIKTDDFNFVMRSHGYELQQLPGKMINPVFGRNDYVTDFTLSDPDTGEVI